MPSGSGKHLLSALVDQWPSYLGYLVSFSTIRRGVVRAHRDHRIPRPCHLGAHPVTGSTCFWRRCWCRPCGVTRCTSGLCGPIWRRGRDDAQQAAHARPGRLCSDARPGTVSRFWRCPATWRSRCSSSCRSMRSGTGRRTHDRFDRRTPTTRPSAKGRRGCDGHPWADSAKSQPISGQIRLVAMPCARSVDDVQASHIS